MLIDAGPCDVIAVCKSVGTATNFEFFDHFESPTHMNCSELKTRPIASILE